MIAITRTEQPTIREEFADVKWTGNVRPVDQATAGKVLDIHRSSKPLARRKPGGES